MKRKGMGKRIAAIVLAITMSIPELVAMVAATSFVFIPPVPTELPVLPFPICISSSVSSST